MIWALIALIVSGSVAIDQWTKYLTVAHLKPISDYPLIEGWLHLSYVENTGMAFGMLKDARWFFLIFSTLGILALLGLLIVFRKRFSLPAIIAVCLVMGGGIGNQIDRIARGFVVDMIYVKIIDFAVFNVADAFVCIGVALMALCLFTTDKWVLEDKPKEIEEKTEPADEAKEKETNDD